jgi:hypothetical protein
VSDVVVLDDQAVAEASSGEGLGDGLVVEDHDVAHC